MCCCPKSSKNSFVIQKRSEPLTRLIILPPPNMQVQLQPKKEVVVVKKKSPKNISAYRLLSNVDKNNIKFCEERPEVAKRSLFPYYCPLCFRYFNSMLICFRCKNYICRFCADEIGEKDAELIRCAFCDCTPFILLDVNEKDSIKKYGDTSYLTGFKLNKKPVVTIKSMSNKENERGQETPRFKGRSDNENKRRERRMLGSYLEEIKENGNLKDWSPKFDESKSKVGVKLNNRPLYEYGIRTVSDMGKGTFKDWDGHEDVEDQEVSIVSV